MSDIFDFTDAGLDETHEETVVEAGAEYQLGIVFIKQDTDKNGDPYILPRYEVIGEPYCKEFTDYIPLPNPDMSKKDLNRSRLKLGSFLTAFGLDINFIGGEVHGKTGWAILGMGTDQDDQPANKINKYVVGH